MAVYTAGRSSLSEWRAGLNAGAPQAIIQKLGGIRFLVPAENARGIDDPGEVSAFWDGFLQSHADLAGEPVRRGFESIWLFDPHVQDGYAAAGWQRIVYPPHAAIWALLPGTAEGREYISTLPELGPQPHWIPAPTGYSPQRDGVDWWLFGHELGHQWQNDDWSARGVVEVQVNLFTMYTLNYYLYGGGDFGIEFGVADPPLRRPVGPRRAGRPPVVLRQRLREARAVSPAHQRVRLGPDPTGLPQLLRSGLRALDVRGSARRLRHTVQPFRSARPRQLLQAVGVTHSRSQPRPPSGDSASRPGYRRAGRRGRSAPVFRTAQRRQRTRLGLSGGRRDTGSGRSGAWTDTSSRPADDLHDGRHREPRTARCGPGATSPNARAAMNLIYLTLRQVERKWQRTPAFWFQARAEFAIQFGDRSPMAAL